MPGSGRSRSSVRARASGRRALRPRLRGDEPESEAVPPDENRKRETPARRSDPRARSFRRRLNVAGLDRVGTGDMDAFRDAMARRIAMAINDWHGCPERICRRQRGCMAPRIACSNRKPGPPPPPERVQRTIAAFYRALEAAAARAETEEG